VSRLAVTGIWHQGMVLCAGLAEIGHEVIGLAAPDEAARLSRAEPLLHEPGLSDLLRRNLDSGRLRFTSDPEDALTDTEFAFVSLDTPVDDEDVPLIEEVLCLAELVGALSPPSAILVLTAQVPVGTTERVGALAGRPTAYVPEFLQLGVAVQSFFEADRVVVGADDDDVAERVIAVYAPLERPILRTNARTAELAKHAANAFLATSISFVNEIGDLAQELGADIWDIARILKLDRRIGPHAYLGPGLGFAGATLGRDLRALQRLAGEVGIEAQLVDAVVAVNEARRESLLRLVARELSELRGSRIALFGLTYKPGTSTLRRAISLSVAEELGRQGAVVTAFDPLADAAALPNDVPLALLRDPLAAARDADVVVHLTGWSGVQDLDLAALRAAMRQPLVIDTQGDFDAGAMRAAGIRYVRFPTGSA
jgi:UDPglucose 6-dehydrogenase